MCFYRNVITLLFVVIWVSGSAQYFSEEELNKIDSLNIVVNDSRSHDTSVVGAYLNLSELLYFSNRDTVIPLCEKSILIAEQSLLKKPSKLVEVTLQKYISNDLNNIGFIHKKNGEKHKAIEYYRKALVMQEKLGVKEDIAISLINIGAFYYQQGDIELALEFYEKSLKINEEVDNKKGLAVTLNNIGSIYKRQGDIALALEYYHQSLAVKKEIGNLDGVATSLNNLGNLYKNQDEHEKALDYYQQALDIQEEGGLKDGLAATLANVGSLYQSEGQSKKALDHFFRSMDIRNEINDADGVGACLSNIGMIYYKENQIDLAEDYLSQSLSIREEIGDKQGIANSLANLGELYFDKRKYNKAKTYGDKSLQLALELGFPGNIEDAAGLLTRVYEKELNGMKALEMHRLYITMRDSVNNGETHKIAANQQAKYDYDKKKTIDDAVHEKEQLQEVAEHEKLIAIEKEEKEKQQIIIYAGIGGLIFLVAFLLFVFNRLKVTRKQKDVIEKHKDEVEFAHIQLEEKNREVIDSISYAKRIQSAILPSNKKINTSLPECFIVYKPKDIVAGDFYWLENSINPITKQDVVLFAAADCTGHGVPGAMVSVFCSNGLNRAVREHNLIDPGAVLDKTREIVIDEFSKSEEDDQEKGFYQVKDGMDIALCSLEGDTLKYAGAHNPLWIIRKGEVIETKANKQPIGQFDKPTPYTTHTFELEKGDTIYLFSDGYVDQFGGEKGKKFKSKSFKDLLLGFQDRSMQEQQRVIDDTFETWKGELEQIDDVCIIGVRI